MQPTMRVCSAGIERMIAMLKVENHKVSERRAARVASIPDLMKAMEGHGNNILFS